MLASLLLAFRRPHRRFSGHWPGRIDRLFDCGADFAGKSVLDVGCNMGVIAYEVSKHGPSFIHGIDRERPHLAVASYIFRGVGVPSKFDRIDLSNVSRFRRAVRDSYGAVLYLAVYHHLKRQHGVKTAAAVTQICAEVCSGDLIARTTETDRPEMLSVFRDCGFEPVVETGNIVRLRSKLA